MPSVLNLYQTNINCIVSTLYGMGLRHAVICPGSRNAPLVMAFARFGRIDCYSVPDERVAGFVALGMSKQLSAPVAVVCTSGTAVLNLYPAVAEAYYMQYPLLVITADRPAEMIGRWDGQTIRQYEVFKPHVLNSFQTPEHLDEDHADAISRTVISLYRQSNGALKGPVHLNVPLKEPLYQAARLEFHYPEIAPEHHAADEPESQVENEIPAHGFDRVMILLGADHSQDCHEQLLLIGKRGSAVVLADVISGMHACQNIPNWESVLLNASESQKKELCPDLLITSGKMLLNKTIKQLLRQHPPKAHWHLAENGFSADTFFTGPKIFRMASARFLEQLNSSLPASETSYFRLFRHLAEEQQRLSDPVLNNGFNAMQAVRILMQELPDALVFSLANSMTVRYFAYLARYLKPGWKLHGNRGVSGIDGCSSTAVGMAMVSRDRHILVTGDIAFYYDINALWQNRLPENLRIILLNDFGGGIFRNIDGPPDLPELDPFISTPHKLTARHMAAHFGTRYYAASGGAELREHLPVFLEGPGVAILEVITDPDINSNIFKQYKSLAL